MRLTLTGYEAKKMPKADWLTVWKLKELLEVIDTNRKASLAIWYVTAHDADPELLDEMSKILKAKKAAPPNLKEK